RIERRLGRRNHFDVEPFEQRPGPELGLAETGIDAIEYAVGCFRRQTLADAEDLVKRVIEPNPGRRAAKNVVMPRKHAPDIARIALDRAAVAAWNRRILQRHPLA